MPIEILDANDGGYEEKKKDLIAKGKPFDVKNFPLEKTPFKYEGYSVEGRIDQSSKTGIAHFRPGLKPLPRFTGDFDTAEMPKD